MVYITPADSFARAAELAGLTGADAEPGARPFSDGVKNLLKYASGLIYTPKYSTDLNGFNPMTAPADVVPIDADWERVVVSQPCDLETTPRCFGVVEVTLPE